LYGPHNILCYILHGARLRNDSCGEFKMLISKSMLSFPILGLFLAIIGCTPVDSYSFKKNLKEGRNVFLVPGGFEEASLTSNDHLVIVIRKGFVKYCL